MGIFEHPHPANDAVGRDALGDRKTQIPRNGCRGAIDGQVIERGPVLATDLNHVPEPFAANERGARALSFEQRVGCDRHAVRERLDGAPTAASSCVTRSRILPEQHQDLLHQPVPASGVHPPHNRLRGSDEGVRVRMPMGMNRRDNIGLGRHHVVDRGAETFGGELHLSELVDDDDVTRSWIFQGGKRVALEHGEIDTVLADARRTGKAYVRQHRAVSGNGFDLETEPPIIPSYLRGRESADGHAQLE